MSWQLHRTGEDKSWDKSAVACSASNKVAHAAPARPIGCTSFGELDVPGREEEKNADAHDPVFISL
jgi:hypothetical protein